MLARKAVTKRSVAPQKGATLRPTPTGGKIYLPGFHRTRQESAAASIVVDTLKSDKLKKGSLYGQGFYMTRIFSSQNRIGMIGNYGKHMVRCRVDVSRFISFDRAVAKRIWGENHTLADQLAEFGPWDEASQKLIDAYSQGLSAFWKDKRSSDAVYPVGHSTYRKVPRGKNKSDTCKIHNSADIARLAYKDLQINKKVPGIVYTGSNDGCCVLAYKIDRVLPLAMTTAPKAGVKITSLTWIDAKNHLIKRKFAPHIALKDDIDTYTQRIRMAGQGKTTQEKIDIIRASYHQLPKDGHDQMAFCVALIKLCRSEALQETRDDILAEFAVSMADYLRIQMPYFRLIKRYKTGAGSKKYVNLSSGSNGSDDEDDDNNTDDDDEDDMAYSKNRTKNYCGLLKSYPVLWDFIRYQVFLKTHEKHRSLLKEIVDEIELIQKMTPPATALVNYINEIDRIFHYLFGGYVSRYGDFTADKPKVVVSHIRFYEKMDGLDIVQQYMDGLIETTGYKRYVSPRALRTRKVEVDVNVVHELIGKEEYTLFMRSQILKLYEALKKHPVGNHPHLKKKLAAWHRQYGKKHKDCVKAHDAFDLIGGETLEFKP